MAPVGTGLASTSIEGRDSWIAAFAALAILAITYGSPLIIVVGMTDVQRSLGTNRSMVALAMSMVWVGTGIGGIAMGHIADRIGIRATVAFGATMTALGLGLSSTGSLWALLVGHGVFMGLLGNGALYPPLVVYVSRWFDRRRGTAVALIASGQYIAGVVWPQPFEWLFRTLGWQATMRAYAILTIAVVLPAVIFLHPYPKLALHALHAARRGAGGERRARAEVLALPANLVQAVICLASFLCCVPMAIPMSQLVAFSVSVGIPMDQSAAMFSVLLVGAFIGRQSWGWLTDHSGPLTTLLASELCQVTAIAIFAFTTGEAALFVLSFAYGLGFSGIIPSYVLTIRGLYSSAEASWRVPLIFLSAMSGMAFGAWFAGALFDHFGDYAPAFGVGVLFNLANIVLVLFLFLRWRSLGSPLATA